MDDQTPINLHNKHWSYPRFEMPGTGTDESTKSKYIRTESDESAASQYIRIDVVTDPKEDNSKVRRDVRDLHPERRIQDILNVKI